MSVTFDPSGLDWQKMDGLIPAVIQDARTGAVLMLGYMNEDSLAATLETQKVTFFSRSRQKIWMKGETSGNVLNLQSITADCDQDSLLIAALPEGPTCHTGTQSCFGSGGGGMLTALSELIEARHQTPVEGSYTNKLMAAGIDRVAQKVGEEAVETVIAAKNDSDRDFLGEAADLVYHLLVLLRLRGMGIAQLAGRLRERHR